MCIFHLFLAQDTDKTLRSLKSNNQPMIKKRQLMQSALGDYRKKMSDEEKKLRIGESMTIKPIVSLKFIYFLTFDNCYQFCTFFLFH